INQNTEGTDIEQAVESQILLLHLLPDAVDVFRTTVHRRVDTGPGQCCGYLRFQVVDVPLAVDAPRGQQAGDLSVLSRIQYAQAKIMQLALESGKAKPVGQRCV